MLGAVKRYTRLSSTCRNKPTHVSHEAENSNTQPLPNVLSSNLTRVAGVTGYSEDFSDVKQEEATRKEVVDYDALTDSHGLVSSGGDYCCRLLVNDVDCQDGLTRPLYYIPSDEDKYLTLCHGLRRMLSWLGLAWESSLASDLERSVVSQLYLPIFFIFSIWRRYLATYILFFVIQMRHCKIGSVTMCTNLRLRS